MKVARKMTLCVVDRRRSTITVVDRRRDKNVQFNHSYIQINVFIHIVVRSTNLCSYVQAVKRKFKRCVISFVLLFLWMILISNLFPPQIETLCVIRYNTYYYSSRCTSSR